MARLSLFCFLCLLSLPSSEPSSLWLISHNAHRFHASARYAPLQRGVRGGGATPELKEAQSLHDSETPGILRGRVPSATFRGERFEGPDGQQTKPDQKVYDSAGRRRTAAAPLASGCEPTLSPPSSAPR
eukprot:2634460-Rhodomonas_salina.1